MYYWQEASLSSLLSGFSMRQLVSSEEQLEGKGAILGPAHSRKGICAVWEHEQVGITGGRLRKLPMMVHPLSLISHVPPYAESSLESSLNVLIPLRHQLRVLNLVI